MPRVILLTGTCGSGKTTIATLLAEQAGWTRLSEDEIWYNCFGKNRGEFGSDEHKCKRQQVHDIVFRQLLTSLRLGRNVAIDATVHESPPEAYEEYRSFFVAQAIEWSIRVLHPRLEVAVARDASRTSWMVGAERVEQLRAKFTGQVFRSECFVDNSDDTPEQTLSRLLKNAV